MPVLPSLYKNKSMPEKNFCNRRLAVIRFCIAVCFFTGCKKFIDIAPPDTLVTSDKVFADNQTALSAMKGVYDKVQKNFCIVNGLTTKLGSLYSNEMVRTSPNSADGVFWSNSLTGNDGTLPGIWSSTYGRIHHVNEIIENLSKATGVSHEMRIQLTAEAKFMRALFYFYLLNYFGEVPLIVNSNYEANAYKPRTSGSAIFQQIIDDLLEAEENLPASYTVTPSFPSERNRPNKLAACALLARVYLYNQDWQNAELKASTVINSGRYNLMKQLNDVFLPSSNEVILHFMPANSSLNTEGAFFVPGPTALKPTYVLAESLLNSFEPGDARKIYWTKQTSINGQNVWYPYKYKVYQNSPPYIEYNVVLRLVEQYLIRAEALAEQNKIAEAIIDLNTIRNRANLPNLSPSLTKPAVLEAIEQERQVELFAEWGHRWFDLKRWPSRTDPTNPLRKRADDILGVLQNGTWQAYKKLWPIPDIEIQMNKNLIQNPGY
jgi:hypothetical protein